MIEFTPRYAFKVLHTPGHTTESVVYLLIDKLNDNKPLKVLN
jgi:glyoxylase-like metal-dependent hydrolase (beta-lactamase superfamily II)